MIWQTIVFLLIGFFFGSIMFGSIISWTFFRKNIRKYGSKNPGSTNTGRVLGKAAGLSTFITDGLKGSLAIGVCFLLKTNLSIFETSNVFVAGLGAVLGHCFSPFMKGQGGKGVATAIGVLCMLSPFFIPILIITWVGSVLLTSYVSVGSILFAAASLAIGLSIPQILQSNFLYQNHGINWTSLDYKIVICVVIGITLLIIVKHHENISRLYNDVEKQVGWRNFLKRKFKDKK